MPGDSGLLDRCRVLAEGLARDALLRQRNAAETIMEFVLSERGRLADPKLDGALPVVLYVGSDEDRQELIEAFREVFPGAVARRV